MNINLKFITGHESFYLREGWLRKGLIAVESNPQIFSKKNLILAINELGVGANMIKSIKYWLEFFSLIEKDNKNQKHDLTEIAKTIIDLDPYYHETATLWILHILSTQPNSLKAKKDRRHPNAFIWQSLFADEGLASFNREKIFAKLSARLKEEGADYAEKTIKSALTIFISTYFSDRKNINPEENMLSPLSKLKLILKIDSTNYQFRTIGSEELSPYIIYFILFFNLKNKTIQLEDAFEIVRKSIKIDILNLRQLLDKLAVDKVISIDRAAGLNNITLLKEIKLDSLLRTILGRNV